MDIDYEKLKEFEMLNLIVNHYEKLSGLINVYCEIYQDSEKCDNCPLQIEDNCFYADILDKIEQIEKYLKEHYR